MALQWHLVAHSEQVVGERPFACHAAGIQLALVRVAGEARAVEDRCPHMAFPLSKGICRDGRLVCTWHHWEFNLAQQQRYATEESRCTEYSVREQGGQVYVGIDLDALPPRPGNFPRPGIDVPAGQ